MVVKLVFLENLVVKNAQLEITVNIDCIFKIFIEETDFVFETKESVCRISKRVLCKEMLFRIYAGLWKNHYRSAGIGR